MKGIVSITGGILTFIAIAAVTLFVVQGFGKHQHRHDIELVFRRRLDSRQKWLERRPPNIVKYSQDIDSFDTSDCPRDFRLAWLDYVESWKAKINVPATVGRAAEFSAGAYAKSGAVILDSARRYDRADTDKTFEKCEKIAVLYDVDFAPR
jgi:hypothetical protein